MGADSQIDCNCTELQESESDLGYDAYQGGLSPAITLREQDLAYARANRR